jgi:hypothetical protein
MGSSECGFKVFALRRENILTELNLHTGSAFQVNELINAACSGDA